MPPAYLLIFLRRSNLQISHHHFLFVSMVIKTGFPAHSEASVCRCSIGQEVGEESVLCQQCGIALSLWTVTEDADDSLLIVLTALRLKHCLLGKEIYYKGQGHFLSTTYRRVMKTLELRETLLKVRKERSKTNQACHQDVSPGGRHFTMNREATTVIFLPCVISDISVTALYAKPCVTSVKSHCSDVAALSSSCWNLPLWVKINDSIFLLWLILNVLIQSLFM